MNETTDFCSRRHTLEIEYLFCKGWGDKVLYKASGYKNSEQNRQIVIYQTKNGAIELKSDVQKETIWATQAQMAFVFGVKPQAITKHLQNIYNEGELQRSATCSILEQVQKEGVGVVG